MENSEQLPADSAVRPHDAFGQSFPQTQQPATPEDDATPWHLLTRPLKMESTKAVDAEPPTLSNTAPPSLAGPGTPSMHGSGRSYSGALYDNDSDAGLSAFCRGAGIDPRSLKSEARSTALQLAGQILRESILGMMDLHHGNHEVRNRFRIDMAPAAAPESPLNLSKGVDETLLRLLNNLSTRAGSVEAMRNSFRELKAEQTAALGAMHTAFEDFLQRVDPKQLEERFERAGKRGVFGTPNKGKYWELYAEMYAGLAQRPTDGFPHLYTEAFARAFEARLRSLLPAKRGGFESAQRDDDPGAKAVGDL